MIEDEFRLEDVNPSPAFFDEKKLRAFNGEYIRALSPEEFIDACQPWLTGTATIPPPPWAPGDYDPAVFAAVAPLAQTRIASSRRSWTTSTSCSWTSRDRRGVLDEDDEGRRDRPPLGGARRVQRRRAWNAETLKTTLEEVGAERGLKLGKAQAPVRVAVTGRTVGLPLFESLEVLGRDRTLARLRAADTA